MNQIKIIIIVVPLFLLSCNQTRKNEPELKKENTVVEKNIKKTVSEDIIELEKILDFSKYKPKQVKFKYTFIDNSGQNERLTVSGPSDYYLEALLYVDSLTMEKFDEFDRNAEYDSPNLRKEEFEFDWLPKEVLEELINSSPKYKGHPEFFFGTGKNGKAWYLKNKILIRTHSD